MGPSGAGRSGGLGPIAFPGLTLEYRGQREPGGESGEPFPSVPEVA